ncbi:MAG: type VI secretion protein, partial [Oscillospiraceae bacterium]
DENDAVPDAFLGVSKLSQHISFLKDFFRCYKDFTDRHLDTIEIMLSKLYDKWRITDRTDFSKLEPTHYPILSDLYKLIEYEFQSFDESQHHIYT